MITVSTGLGRGRGRPQMVPSDQTLTPSQRAPLHGLGMIPAWQHSLDPGVNIKINPNVQFPDGWTQSTIQPVGAYYTVARTAQPNLGSADGCCPKCACGGDNPCCITEGMRTSVFTRLRHMVAVRRNQQQMRGLGMVIPRTLGAFDSWTFENRKWILLGGLGLIAAAGAGITAAVLR